MTIDNLRLRRIAKTATSGPWEYTTSSRDWKTVWLLGYGRSFIAEGDAERAPDFRHIAAWHPGRALAALKVIEAAMRYRDQDEFDVDTLEHVPTALAQALREWEETT